MELEGEKDLVTLKELCNAKGDLRLEGEWMIGGNEQIVEYDWKRMPISAPADFVYPSRTLGEVVFYQPPRLKVAGKIHLDRLGTFQVSQPADHRGRRVRLRAPDEPRHVLDGLSFQFSVQGNRFYLLNLRLDHETGVLLANLFRP